MMKRQAPIMLPMLRRFAMSKERNDCRSVVQRKD